MMLAGFPPDRPLPPGAAAMPHVRRFVEAWGRDGDVGVLAVDEAERPVGAAWARRLDRPIPEVAIAVEAAARGRGTGTALLLALERAAGRGRAPGARSHRLAAQPGRAAVRACRI